MIKFLFKRLSSSIDSLITRRLILFHDALVDRGQIKRLPIPRTISETNHYMVDKDKRDLLGLIDDEHNP
jgi:hypothetical protein